MKYRQAIVLLAASVLLFGCDNSVDGNVITGGSIFASEQNPYFLNGTVLDAQGTPLFNADIHYMMRFNGTDVMVPRMPMKTMPSTYISFSIPADGNVQVNIYRLGTRELIATLVDTALRSGAHQVRFDAANCTNGIYIYQIIAKNFFVQKLMVLENEDLSSLVRTTPLVRTSYHGTFRLPLSLFGLEEDFQLTAEKPASAVERFKIDSIAIVVNINGKRPLVQWMNINNNSNMEHTFIVQ